jgi:glutamine synthetase type III
MARTSAAWSCTAEARNGDDNLRVTLDVVDELIAERRADAVADRSV